MIEAGKPIERGLGSALMDFRDECPELYQKMYDLGFRFYQQPAGFEDQQITVWKIKEQAKEYGQTIGVRDLFGGALAEASRDTMFLCQQLSAWIRPKITAIVQVSDTHVIRPIKVRKLAKDVELRRELIKLSELEKTPLIFKCGMYEIMRTLYKVISELIAEWGPDKYLLRAMYQNGWLSLRPSLSQGKLVRSDTQAWTKGFRFGSHRIQQSWADERFSHIDENGVPKPIELEMKHGETEDTEQTYSREPGQKRDLKMWKEMISTGEISREELAEFRDEPWFEMEVQNFEGLEGLDEYKELLKTPAQRRKELGIDQYLTSQKQNTDKQMRKKRSRQLIKQSRAPLRKEALESIRALKEQGHSLETISAQLIHPSVGKSGAVKKKSLRDAMAQKLQKNKAQAKAKPKAKAKANDEVPVHLPLRISAPGPGPEF